MVWQCVLGCIESAKVAACLSAPSGGVESLLVLGDSILLPSMLLPRPAQVYKKENKSLMSSYDDWLKTMVKTRPGALSGGQ